MTPRPAQPVTADTSILISSFDGFADCWAPFFHGLRKYWPNCPYPAYLITNDKVGPDPHCTSLCLGPDRQWSGNMLAALERIDSRFVIYFQEDYWITKPVDGGRIASYLRLMTEEDVPYIRLMASPPPDELYGSDKRLGVCRVGAKYRSNLQLAIWRRDALIDLIQEGESQWDFETIGSRRGDLYPGLFLSVRKCRRDPHAYGIPYTYTAVNQGKWSRVARAYANDEGLDLDFSHRLHEGRLDEIRRWGFAHGVSGPVDAVVANLYRLRLVVTNPVLAITKTRARLSGGQKP